jgi:hypothetical protein
MPAQIDRNTKGHTTTWRDKEPHSMAAQQHTQRKHARKTGSISELENTQRAAMV